METLERSIEREKGMIHYYQEFLDKAIKMHAAFQTVGETKEAKRQLNDIEHYKNEVFHHQRNVDALEFYLKAQLQVA